MTTGRTIANRWQKMRLAPVLLVFAYGTFALNAVGDETRKLPRSLPIYNGASGASWHPCQTERLWRIENDLDSYTNKEIAELVQRAEAGDLETMYLLSRVTRKGNDGNTDYEFQIYWRQKALAKGHPVRLWEAGITTYKEGQISLEEYIKLAETAAREHNGKDIAYQLGLGYAVPGIAAPFFFDFLPANPAKACYWMQYAAELGNAAAADQLCTFYYHGNEHFGVPQDYAEARKWCVMAVQATCSTSSSLVLSHLYEKGLGVPRNLPEAHYWMRMWESRFRPAKLQGE